MKKGLQIVLCTRGKIQGTGIKKLYRRNRGALKNRGRPARKKFHQGRRNGLDREGGTVCQEVSERHRLRPAILGGREKTSQKESDAKK